MTVRCLSDAPPAHDRRMTIAGSAAWHYIDLDAALEDIRSRLQPAVRRNITSAQRNGIEVVVSSGIDAIRAYHRLHVWLRKHKYRMLAQPVEFFERIWNAFAPEDGVVTLLAHVDGKPVAGAVYLVWNDALYYKFGASLAEYLPMRPNEALHWTAIRWAVDRGLRLFDWGRSDLDQPGLMAYKSKWGSVESRIVLLRAGSDSQLARPGIGPVLGELTRLLTDDAVPDEVTARAGAILYRYFS